MQEQPDAQPKYAQLYKLHKKQIDRTDKTKEDYEFERQQEECTFAPTIYTKNKEYANKESAIRSKNQISQMSAASNPAPNKDRQKMMEEKQKERLRRAREEKERVNEMLERGIPKPKQMT